MLAGYKTYITAAVAVIGGIAAYLTGDASLVQTAQLVFTAVLGATICPGFPAAPRALTDPVKLPTFLKPIATSASKTR